MSTTATKAKAKAKSNPFTPDSAGAPRGPRGIGATTHAASIDVGSLSAPHRALLGKLVESAGKQITKGLPKGEDRCAQGSHKGSVTLVIEGEVVVSADATIPAKTVEHRELSLAEIVAAQVGPKKIAAWIEQGAKAVKAARRAKAGREELEAGAEAIDQLITAQAKSLKLICTEEIPAGARAGAQRCEPRVEIREFTAQ